MTDEELIAVDRAFYVAKNDDAFAPAYDNGETNETVRELCDRLTARNAELAQAREEIRRREEMWERLVKWIANEQLYLERQPDAKESLRWNVKVAIQMASIQLEHRQLDPTPQLAAAPGREGAE